MSSESHLFLNLTFLRSVIYIVYSPFKFLDSTSSSSSRYFYHKDIFFLSLPSSLFFLFPHPYFFFGNFCFRLSSLLLDYFVSSNLLFFLPSLASLTAFLLYPSVSPPPLLYPSRFFHLVWFSTYFTPPHPLVPFLCQICFPFPNLHSFFFFLHSSPFVLRPPTRTFFAFS